MALLMVLASAAEHNLFPPRLSPAMYQQSEPWAFQKACPLSSPRPSPCSASYLGFALSLTCPPASSRLREPAMLLRSGFKQVCPSHLAVTFFIKFLPI